MLCLKIDTWSPQIVELLAHAAAPQVEVVAATTPSDVAHRDGLWVHPSVDLKEREALLERLRPLTPFVHVTAAISPDEAVLRWREPADMGPGRVHIQTNAPRAAKRLLMAMNGALPATGDGLILQASQEKSRAQIVHEHLHPAFVQTIELLAQSERFAMPPAALAFDAQAPLTITLLAPSPLEVATEVPVILYTDCPVDDPDLAALMDDLGAAGHVEIDVLPLQSAAHTIPFAITCGAVEHLSTPRAALVGRIVEGMKAWGVDPARHPLEDESHRSFLGRAAVEQMPLRSVWDRLAVRIVLPLQAWREGRLPAYGPGQAAVHLLTVQTPNPEAPIDAAILAALADLGFSVRSAPLPDEPFHCTVQSDQLHRDKALRGEVERVLQHEGEPAPHFVALNNARHHALISLTHSLTPEERARRALAARGRLSIAFCVADAPTLDPEPAMERLRAMGYHVEEEVTISSDPEYIYIRAGASTPPVFLKEMETVVNEMLREAELFGRVFFDDPDPYPEGRVCINIPSIDFLNTENPEELDSVDPPKRPPAPSEDPFAAWLPASARAVGPFLRAEGEALWVGAHRLPRRGRPVAAGADLDAWVIDDTAAATLAFLARAVTLRVPALLEGPTATSKTSAVLFLAQRLGQPVVRVNLSAHADTAELIGRFTPDPSGAGWRWHDGAVLRAVKEGGWLILDELNLAEPAVLERLNPLLEAEPSLLVTEHQGERFGPGGAPVHPAFRVFATLNPMTYGGRQRLSPALRDRFIAARTVGLPTQEDLAVMVHHLILGEAYSVEEGGRRYTQPAQSPIYPWHGVEVDLLDRLAGLFAGLMALAGDDLYAGLDEEGAERPVYTRRTLKALLRDVSLALQAGAVLDDALRGSLLFLVVSRAARPAHRQALAAILDANGLGPSTWQTRALA